ncbi:Pimeloyl-ACP methyl ester carboxylesterase [Cohaesibacter sp. ES.047]|uniref:alpha/beta fold hydrolase n=1 Tax=Cohaesibacter sp. ES.047 TaxID=1798205 RepID=UPI000BB78292|nr:alpha/beta hydrolase [Cohaesibacter sp. ES.047]SNY91062.1 Pimeloyl-ACP methyl ester carboxylesterase [Cohaesibacter sp. ES.047]
MPRLQTPDERHLAWHEWGKEDGAPVLYCPGAGMAGLLPFGEDVCSAQGLRMISVDRPGLGGSDPDEGKSFTSWQSDIAHLLDHLGVSSVKTIGFSQGAPFALALGAAGIASSVTIVSGQDELSHPKVISQLPAPVASMVDLATNKPDALQDEIEKSATPDWLMQMIETMSSDQDRAFYMAPDFAPRYRQSLEDGFCQGPVGYAQDTVLAMAPWTFDVEEMPCPVQLWYGLRDISPVHAPDFGETLAERLPSATLSRIPSEGSAILWTRSEEILSAL